MRGLVRKELLEWFNGGASGHWGRYEFLIAVIIIGVLAPVMMPTGMASTMLLVMAAFLPVFMTATAAADSIAGERERGTLQTLFLLPLSDSEIVAGKIVGAVGYALFLSVGGIVLGNAVLLLRGMPIPPLWADPAAIAFCALVGTLFCACVSWISFGKVTARQAQQYAFLPLYVLIFGMVAARGLHIPWPPGGGAAFAAAALAHPYLCAAAAALLICACDAALVLACVQRLRSVRCER